MGKLPGRDSLNLERQELTRQKWVGRRGSEHSLSKGPEATVPGHHLRLPRGPRDIGHKLGANADTYFKKTAINTF